MATDDHMAVTAVGLPPSATSMSFGRFELENGQYIDDVVLGYTTYGELNAVRPSPPPALARIRPCSTRFFCLSPPRRDPRVARLTDPRARPTPLASQAGDNAVIVGHSLTSNSNVAEWWGAILGEGPEYSLDHSNDFVVCANYLGSPYGSSSPVTPDPKKANGECYAADFPTPVTIRDNVRLQRMLLDRLGVKHLRMAIGGSMGSMVALEWAASYPDYVTELVLIAGCGRHTDWAIGLGEAQRFSIMSDAKFKGGDYNPADPPRAGLATSRMMAMLSYRAPASVDERFSRGSMLGDGVLRKPSSHADLGLAAHANESTSEALPYFAVESYLQYQGKKFIQRFDANCYIQLTYTLDSHDVARGRGEYAEVLRRLTHRTLVVGITSDVLYPFHLQTELADGLPNAEMYAIDSPHGHDAFLIEIKQLNDAIARFRRGQRADPNAERVAAAAAAVAAELGGAANGEREPVRTDALDPGELRGAVRALESELERYRERAEREARRADALLAEVARLKDEAVARDAGGDGIDGRGSDGDGAVVSGYGLRALPANPPPYRRFQPVYGEVRSPGGTDAPVAALGAF